jgi:hypothetical protein
MGTSRRCAAVMSAVSAAVLATACGDSAVSPATSAPSQPAATPSVASPGGALAGFLAAARNQDSSQVPVWLASTTDTTDLNELLRVYSSFGNSGGFFWEVSHLRVIAVAGTGTGRANVTLSGDIVWCLGKAPNDPSATCSVVNAVSGLRHTYAALQVDGGWKADIDVNSSSGLDHNPETSPTAGAATATPTAA